MDHFGAIGLHVGDEREFERVVGAALQGAVVDAPAPAPGRHLLWTDPSGAALALHLEGPQIACAKPFFVAPSPARWRARTSAPADDPGCAHCGGADCDLLDAAGETVTRASVEWLHYQPYRAWLGAPRTFGLQVVAFAHRLAFYADEAAFERDQGSWWPGIEDRKMPDGRPMRFAADAFLPEGLFAEPGDMGTRAVAMFAGRVELAERPTNALTGRSFLHARVATLPGPVDVVAAEAEGTPAPGAIAVVRGWLVGRPDVPAPEADAPRRGAGGWLRRLLRPRRA